MTRCVGTLQPCDGEARAEGGDLAGKTGLALESISISRSRIMISRLWRGVARVECTAAYIAHLQQETFPAIRRLPGFKRAAILHRPCDRGTEFLIVTEWESEQAIAAFAGDDVLAAVVPEGVRRMMVEFDERASHYTMVG
jgi:heme-degrading monooxygenase HmoA